jgi:Ca2+-binding RTX toxin-like protein
MANLTGTSGNDTLAGGNTDDLLQGLGGDDALYGGKGNDTLDGGTHGLFGDTADYTGATTGVVANLATGIASDDQGGTDTLLNIQNIFTDHGNDYLTGDDNNNLFMPRGGDDNVDGGGGSDTISYADDYAGDTIDLQAGTATGQFAGHDTLESIENVIGSDFNDVILLSDASGSANGRDGNDSITGGAGDDTLRGGAGNDTLAGGAGFDILSYADATSSGTIGTKGVTVNLATGAATDNWANADHVSGIEEVIGTSLDDTLIGGNAASDSLEVFLGGGGADSIDGGTGWDRVLYTTSTSGIIVSMTTGVVTDGLGSTDKLVGIEEVWGSAFGDSIKGGSAAESFEGGGGNDTLDGGGGIDRVTYMSSPAGAVINLVAGTASDGWGGSDTLANFENVLGSDYADTITGNDGPNDLNGGAGDDSIVGGNGNDIITGGPGNDTIDGGGGTDTAVFAGDFDSYDIDSGTGLDVIVSGPDGTDTLRNVELLQFDDETFAVIHGTTAADTLAGGAEDDALFGGAGDDSISGGAGNDVLDGGTGNDVMAGGTGDDTYVVDSDGDQVVETDATSVVAGVQIASIGGGIDKVVASINYTLGNFVENLQLTGGNVALSGAGNSLSNQITGNEGDNVLTGMGGDDQIDGAAGIDTAVYTGTRSQYTVTKTATGFTVNGAQTQEGTDTVTNVERLQFSDGHLALDPSGNAGEVAKILGAVFGVGSLTNQHYVGIGLHYTDTGMSYADLMQLAINAALGPNSSSHTEIVKLLYTNVIGVAPDAATLSYFTGLLDDGTYTASSLGILAADISYNTDHIHLTGLAATGLAYD